MSTLSAECAAAAFLLIPLGCYNIIKRLKVMHFNTAVIGGFTFPQHHRSSPPHRPKSQSREQMCEMEKHERNFEALIVLFSCKFFSEAK